MLAGEVVAGTGAYGGNRVYFGAELVDLHFDHVELGAAILQGTA